MPDFKEITIDEARLIHNGHVVEHKVDGACMTWDGTNLVSERGVVRNDRFPHIVAELSQFDWKLQGEIAVPGGHVLQINAKANWPKGRFYAFAITEMDGEDWEDATPVDTRRKLDEFFSKGTNTFDHLRTVKRFKSFAEGWKHVERANRKGYAEGVVMKPEQGGKGFKIKNWKEAKMPIVGHDAGSVKGSFRILSPNGEVSGCSALSVGFVKAYNDLIAAGEKPYAELEYLLLTDNGVPFQPRLRNVDILANL